MATPLKKPQVYRPIDTDPLGNHLSLGKNVHFPTGSLVIAYVIGYNVAVIV